MESLSVVRIVILINQSKQQLEAEIDQSRLKFWLKKASIETIDSPDVWSKLYYAFKWSQDQSLARTLATKSNINGHCLIASPVHVEVGMRNSECHALNKRDAYFSESQLGAFNDFFSGEFRLHPFNGLHYLLEFEQAPDFNLAKKHWPPYLSDYRVQVQAAKGELVRYLTELQAWCHQQESAWNALYLWSNSGLESLPSVSLEDKTETSIYSLLNLLTCDDAAKTKDIIIGVDNVTELETIIPEIEDSLINGALETVSFTFIDKNIYSLNSENLRPWWKNIF